MRKLLAANSARLKKDKIFWLSLICLSAASVFFSFLSYQTSMRFDYISSYYDEDLLFNLLPMIPFVCAMFISLHLGTEFDENTIRNKLIVGHTRTEIYFANYLTCMFASLILLAAILLFSGVTGYIFFKEFLMGWTQIAFLILCCILITMVFSAICVGFAMSIHKKAGAVVVTILFMLGILYLASYMEGALLEGEMIYDGVTITMDGVQLGDLIENLNYVSGTARKVMEFFFDMLPTGQAIQMNNMSFDRCLRWPWLSVITLVITTFTGYLPFRKRDIR